MVSTGGGEGRVGGDDVGIPPGETVVGGRWGALGGIVEIGFLGRGGGDGGGGEKEEGGEGEEHR